MQGCHAISIDNFDGAQQVVRHLAELGHHRIATVTGPPRNMDARQRLEGYRAALVDAGLARRAGYEIEGDFTEPSGYRAGQTILRLAPRPTAVFVGNDKMAVGVLGALSDGGVRVPDDIAVAGFDDIELAFTPVQDYRAPQWPESEHPKQFHLDFEVDDIEAEQSRVLALGASLKRDFTDPDGYGFRVYTDPVGHPFCLCRNKGVVWTDQGLVWPERA